MKLLTKLFSRNKNPMLEKLERITKVNLKEVYYSFGFVYSNDNYQKFKKCLEQNSLAIAKKELEFDVKEDNLEIYFVTDFNDIKYIIILIDYFEPLQKEEILEKIILISFPDIEMERLK